jgi:hypothetical protein
MTTATQEITVRIARTIQVPSGAGHSDQFEKYEPLLAEVTIREACPKKKYDERLDELFNLASEKVFGYLDGGEEIPEGEEVQGEEGLAGEGEYEEGQGEEGGFLPEEGEEGFEGGEEGGEEGFEGGEEGGEEDQGEEEFNDFFDDDPGGEVE